MFLARGTDPGALDRDGTTPLQEAAKGGNLAVTRLPLERGVPIHAKTKDGRTALAIAETSDCLIGGSPMTSALRRRVGSR